MIPRRPAILKFLMLALPLTFTCGHATTYYVDYAAGSDANPGKSTSAAWRHCPGDPAATGAAAAANLVGGDTVRFKGGVAYVLTGASGIDLKWNGTSAAPITYDGNTAGTWGSGHARLTDNFGANSITAFTARAAASGLSFRSLEFAAIGGAAKLPANAGSAVGPRYGAGIDFKLAATSVVIDGCVFRQLGYAFNAKPMNAAAINGVGIRLASASAVTISNCEFTQVGAAIEMYGAASLTNVTISGCAFHDNVCWTVDLPPVWVKPTNLVVTGCTETSNGQFTSAAWAGHGPGPRTTVRTANAGAYVGMSVTLAATPTATYQWRKNGVAIAGATTAVLGLSSVTTADAGTYTVVATNAAGAATSNDIVLSVTAAAAIASTSTTTSAPAPLTVAAVTPTVISTSSIPAGTTSASRVVPAMGDASGVSTAATSSRLTNVSVRGETTAAAGPLIVGFVVEGQSAKPLLVRAVGPTLSRYGVTSALPDPAVSLYSGRSLMGTNARWAASADAARLTAAAESVGAFALAADSADAALLPTLEAGAYTAQVRSASGRDGVALLEVYDADHNGAAKLVNVSVRANLATGAGNPIVGFVVEGSTSKRLLIRAVGPSLAQFGVTNALADPQLTVVRAGKTVASNDNWDSDNAVANAANSVGAFPLSAAKDAALVIDAAPGLYSAVVNATDGGQGVVLLEVYELP